jgi:ketosteroid isomerase-like protein
MAFASASKAVGVKRAFLTWLADDAIVFRPGPVNAKQWYAGRPESKVSLSWYPAVAMAAEAGDLGYTTGPYEFRAKGPDDTEVSYGSFVSVWRRQKDGSWKVVLDTGAECPRPEPPPPHWRAPGTAAGSPGAVGGAKAARKALTAPQRAAERQSLFSLDRGVCGQGGKPGAGSPKGAGGVPAAGDDTLVLRDGLPPATGKEAVQQAAATWARTRCEPSAGDVSASGDLGYIYGTFERRGATAGAGAAAGAGGAGGAGATGTAGAAGPAGGAPTAEGTSEKGYYLRIWSRQGRSTWRLLLDVEMPLPPAAN